MTLTFKRWARWPRPPHHKRRFLSGAMKFDVHRNDLVARLLELETTEATVALDFDESEMREDGWPRANAVPKSPGIFLVVKCRFGTLLLACDTYVHWLQNLHALVLVLEHMHKAASHELLPAHDVYAPFRWEGLPGWLATQPFSRDLSRIRITASGKGKWTATTRIESEWASSRATEPPPPRPKEPPRQPPRSQTNQARESHSETFSTRAKAATWLADKTGMLAPQLLVDERAFVEAYRLAARTMHPDVGGEASQFRRLQNAKIAIERGAPWTK